MARLPRLVLPGRPHLVIQRGHSGHPAFADDADRHACLDALREACAVNGVAVHAFALADVEVHLIVTPPTAKALSRMMQTVGRKYVSAYNRRYGCSGTLWDGRFRCAVIGPGEWLLAALQLVDGQGGLTSAGHRTGGARDPMLVDPPEIWQLGNTPFEREIAYRTLLVHGVPEREAAVLRRSALGGWAIGSPDFLALAAAETTRPLRPRPRGRPARARLAT
jgi:putative transposase